jgi:hypothetical protein
MSASCSFVPVARRHHCRYRLSNVHAMAAISAFPCGFFRRESHEVERELPRLAATARLTEAISRGSCRARSGVPIDEPVHERVGEGLRVLGRRLRIRAAAAARDE